MYLGAERGDDLAAERPGQVAFGRLKLGLGAGGLGFGCFLSAFEVREQTPEPGRGFGELPLQGQPGCLLAPHFLEQCRLCRDGRVEFCLLVKSGLSVRENDVSV